MESNFWHQRWANNQIGFHEPAANPLLVKHFERLNLENGSRIFLPLCGKTLDIAWLLGQGYHVVGAELSKLAIDQLFGELNIAPSITREGKLERYQADHIDILVGDIFDITQSILGKVDAIYDRAALVALPADMRKRYARHLVDLTNAAPQLLICFEYDQSLVDGPPFSVNAEEVKRQYQENYQMTLLETVSTNVKGQFDATEVVWSLQSKS
jgi:thiopurine S-methyltransferase